MMEYRYFCDRVFYEVRIYVIYLEARIEDLSEIVRRFQRNRKSVVLKRLSSCYIYKVIEKRKEVIIGQGEDQDYFIVGVF